MVPAHISYFGVFTLNLLTLQQTKADLLNSFLHLRNCCSSSMNMKQDLYYQFVERKRQAKKSFAVLIDPDKITSASVDEIVHLSVTA